MHSCLESHLGILFYTCVYMNVRKLCSCNSLYSRPLLKVESMNLQPRDCLGISRNAVSGQTSESPNQNLPLHKISRCFRCLDYRTMYQPNAPWIISGISFQFTIICRLNRLDSVMQSREIQYRLFTSICVQSWKSSPLWLWLTEYFCGVRTCGACFLRISSSRSWMIPPRWGHSHLRHDSPGLFRKLSRNDDISNIYPLVT